jgi:hypothetical protein
MGCRWTSSSDVSLNHYFLFSHFEPSPGCDLEPRGEGTEEASVNFQFLFSIRCVGHESCTRPMYPGA